MNYYDVMGFNREAMAQECVAKGLTKVQAERFCREVLTREWGELFMLPSSDEPVIPPLETRVSPQNITSVRYRGVNILANNLRKYLANR